MYRLHSHWHNSPTRMTLPASPLVNPPANFVVQVFDGAVQRVLDACHSFFFGPPELPGQSSSPLNAHEGPNRRLRRQNRHLIRRSIQNLGLISGSSSSSISIDGVAEEWRDRPWYPCHQSPYRDKELYRKAIRQVPGSKQSRALSNSRALIPEDRSEENNCGVSYDNSLHIQFSALGKLPRKLAFRKMQNISSFRPLKVQAGRGTIRYKDTVFRIHEILGEGNFATIMRVTDSLKNVYAMKVYNKSRLKNSIKEAQSAERKESADGRGTLGQGCLSSWVPAYDELEVLSRISKYEDNPFLPYLRCAFEDEKNYYLIMTFYNESLLETINRTRLSLENIRLYSAQLICALESLHSLKIIHRDLKPENILITSRGDISLTDFNCSSCFELNRPSRDCISTDQSGTAFYMAPENFDKRQLCTWKADIWSLGLVMLDMFRVHITPSQSETSEENPEEAIHEVIQDLVGDKHAKNLITSMIQTDAELRPSLTEVKTSPFFDKINWTLLRNHDYMSEYRPPQPCFTGCEQGTLAFKEDLDLESEDYQDIDDPPPGPFEYEALRRKSGCDCKPLRTSGFFGLGMPLGYPSVHPQAHLKKVQAEQAKEALPHDIKSRLSASAKAPCLGDKNIDEFENPVTSGTANHSDSGVNISAS